MPEEFLKYVLLEYVAYPMQAKGIPWALIAVDPASPNSRILIHEIERCGPWIEDHDREYLNALLSDWKATLNRDGVELLRAVSELAIGPLRTSVTGECAKEELRGLVESRCGPVD
jgi:hypothetical protein